ncbi:hypothetical protein Tco_0532408 [Tanacetum coccineum]
MMVEDEYGFMENSLFPKVVHSGKPNGSVYGNPFRIVPSTTSPDGHISTTYRQGPSPPHLPTYSIRQAHAHEIWNNVEQLNAMLGNNSTTTLVNDMRDYSARNPYSQHGTLNLSTIFQSYRGKYGTNVRSEHGYLNHTLCSDQYSSQILRASCQKDSQETGAFYNKFLIPLAYVPTHICTCSFITLNSILNATAGGVTE